VITYQHESFDHVIDEIKPMLEQHYYEVCAHPQVLKLNPDYTKYKEFDRMGLIRIFTARDQEHKARLIGYFISFIHPHMHYQDTVYAVNDVLYLDPEYRSGSVAYHLTNEALDDLKGCGVDIVTVHMKIKHEFRRLLRHLGFEQTEENWEVIL
jgi:GNAT superfamily N-acetyltransferase